nr:hypothetical protein [Nocardia abscessus]
MFDYLAVDVGELPILGEEGGLEVRLITPVPVDESDKVSSWEVESGVLEVLHADRSGCVAEQVSWGEVPMARTTVIVLSSVRSRWGRAPSRNLSQQARPTVRRPAEHIDPPHPLGHPHRMPQL